MRLLRLRWNRIVALLIVGVGAVASAQVINPPVGACPLAGCTFTGPITAPSYSTNGTTNGALNLTSTGTLPAAAATSTVQMTVPNSVTAYSFELPAAQPTTGNTFLSCTSANPAVCSWAAAGGGSGTVTSVSQTVPTSFLSIAGSPITTSGTLALGLTSAAADTVWGNPTGSSATPIYTSSPVLTSVITTGSGNGFVGLDSSTACVSGTTCADYLSYVSAGLLSLDTTTLGNGLAALQLGQIRNSLMQVASAATIASATTIAPTTPLVAISGTTAIATITLPSGFTSGCFDILATGLWTTTTAGNIQATLTAVTNTMYRACYWTGLSKWTIK